MRPSSWLTRPAFVAAIGLVLASFVGCAPPVPPSIDHPLVGYAVPTFEESSVYNEPVNVPAYSSARVTVIDFWASWCGSCMDSMPELEGLYRERKPDGLAVVGVSVDDRAEDAARGAYAFGETIPIVHDASHQLASSFHVYQIPTTFVVDRAGTIRYVGRNPANVRIAVSALLDR